MKRIKVERVEDLPRRGILSWQEIAHLFKPLGINHKQFLRLSRQGKAPANIGIGRTKLYTGAALARWFNEPENRAKLAANTPNPA